LIIDCKVDRHFNEVKFVIIGLPGLFLHFSVQRVGETRYEGLHRDTTLSWGGPWTTHAVCLLLLDVLEGWWDRMRCGVYRLLHVVELRAPVSGLIR
jgi:hypothetical protein